MTPFIAGLTKYSRVLKGITKSALVVNTVIGGVQTLDAFHSGASDRYARLGKTSMDLLVGTGAILCPALAPAAAAYFLYDLTGGTDRLWGIKE